MPSLTTSSTDTTPPTSSGSGVAMSIDSARQKIDKIDAEIIRLIASRIGMSGLIRDLKGVYGLPRTDLKRESEVIAKYVESFGTEGAVIAAHLLTVSKAVSS